MDRRLIMHVGTEKTGTSSIQKYLWTNRDSLKEKGWLYLDALGPGPNIKLTACALEFNPNSPVLKSLGIHTAEDLKKHSAQLHSTIENEIAQENPNTILISDEHLNVHLKSQSELANIRQYFPRTHVDKIIIYLRKQERFLESILSEGIKNQSIPNIGKGKPDSFLDQFGFFQNKIPYRFDYLRIIENLTKSFPEAVLQVRAYKTDIESFDAVSDFVEAVELPISSPQLNGFRENRSIPGRLMQSLLQVGFYSNQLHDANFKKNWRRIISEASIAFPGLPFRMSEKDSKLLFDRFDEQNKILSEKYPHLQPILYKESEKSNSNVSLAEDQVTVSELFDAVEHIIPKNSLNTIAQIKAMSKVEQNNMNCVSTPFDSNKETTAQTAIHLKDVDSENYDANTIVKATCPICGGVYDLDITKEYREGPLCTHCGASGRSSAIVHTVCQIAFGNDTPLCQQSPAKDFKLVGLSDGPKYAPLLAEKFDYTNTFYHKEPYLDISSPDETHHNRYDLLISTEVFEHVIGEPLSPFYGALALLKPGGSLVLTVPFVNQGEHKQHYPGLVSYSSRQTDEGKWVADLVFADGTKYTDENAKFHGGPGKTLEICLFTRTSLLKALEDSGFTDIEFHDKNIPERGINWGAPSRLVTAKKPIN